MYICICISLSLSIYIYICVCMYIYIYINNTNNNNNNNKYIFRRAASRLRHAGAAALLGQLQPRACVAEELGALAQPRGLLLLL